VVDENEVVAVALTKSWVLLLQICVAITLFQLVIKVVFELVYVLDPLFVLLLWNLVLVNHSCFWWCDFVNYHSATSNWTFTSSACGSLRRFNIWTSNLVEVYVPNGFTSWNS
jgi:hypothetical protein